MLTAESAHTLRQVLGGRASWRVRRTNPEYVARLTAQGTENLRRVNEERRRQKALKSLDAKSLTGRSKILICDKCGLPYRPE